MDGKTPVSALQELLVKRQIVPNYNLISNNVGTHEPIFQYEVSAGSSSAIGSGKSKKEAKHNAARELLKVMNEIPSTEDVTSPYEGVLKENAVGELYDFCLANQLKIPEYKLTRDEGLSHAKVFSISCTISSFTTEGTARTKKNAKQIAAQDMLVILKEYLKDIIVEHPNESPPISSVGQSHLRMSKAISEVKLEKRADKLGISIADYCFVLKETTEFELPYLDSLKENFSGTYQPKLGENCEEMLYKITEELQCTITLLKLPSRGDEKLVAYCLLVNSNPPWTFMANGLNENETLNDLYCQAIEFLIKMRL